MTAAARIAGARLEQATRADLDRIMEIEHASFPNPWSRQVFVEELAHSYARVMVLRAAPDAEIVGFINYWIVHDEIHILNVATDPIHRRRGIGRRLVEHAIEIAVTIGCRLVTLEVRRSNVAAQDLYSSLGFVAVAVRPRYYENAEDAIIMNLDLSEQLTGEE